MKAWLFGLFSIAIISVMVSILLEKSRLYKTIQSVLTMLLACVMITPLLSLQGESFSSFFQMQEVESVSSNYGTSIAEIKKTFLEEKCEDFLSKCGVEGDVLLTGEFTTENSISTVSVYLQDSGINQSEENIVELRKAIANFCEVREETVAVYVGKSKIPFE